VKDAPRKRHHKQEQRKAKKVVIPTKAAIQAMIAKAEGRFRPLFITAVFTGMRASELRGLTWDCVDLQKGRITVEKRMDAWNELGEPKSDNSKRSIPLAPIVVNTLKEWKLACPKGELSLVFPNGSGKPESLGNITQREYWPLQKAAALTRRYNFHALRHFAASLFIEEGLSPKKVQTRMGHSSIKVTYDIYGHLFTDEEDDRQEMAAIQAKLLA
jgi:integrase